MKKTSTPSFLKQLLFFLTILFCNLNVHGQAVNQSAGEFIPLTKTYPDPSKGDPEIIQGEMVIFGNSILGFMANDTASPNGDFNDEVSSSEQRRGYIDIDSDPNRDTNYQVGGVPIFNPLLPSSETDYNGIPGTLSGDGTTLSNGEPILDIYGAPNYGEWLDGSPSLTGPFLPGIEEGTFSSSSAELKINSTNEDCSRVQRAYLYWSGLYSGEQFVFEGSGGTRNFQRVRRERPDCIDVNGDPCELYTDIRILPPNATEYVDIKFVPDASDGYGLKTEILYDDTWSRFLGYSHSVYNKQSTVYPAAGFNNMNQNAGWQPHPSYACRADITSLFNDLESSGEPVEGFWTVANIRSTVGRKGWGLGAGWSIVLVYEDPNADQKYITFFDGYVNVTSNSTNTVIDGFTTIPDGDVKVEFASLSLEGDIRLYGDNFRMNGTNIASVKPAGVVSDIGYDPNNYMDSSIISIDRSPTPQVNLRRFPNSINNMGYDSDHFVLNNLNNSIIDNGDSSADVVVDTGPNSNDQSSTYFTAFSVEVIAPNIQIFKEALDADGNVITSDQVRNLGDEITYRMTLTNVGNGEAINTTFRDIIPINTVFDPATANFTVSPPLPAGFDFTYDLNYDSGETDINGNPILTTRVSLEIPDSLDTTSGQGFLEPDDEIVIEFSVSVVADCRLLRNACDGQINNQADAEYSTIFDNGAIIPVQSAFAKDDCNLLIQGPTLSLADQAACSSNPIVEILCIEEPLEVSAGNGFDIYEWYFDNPAGTPAEIGVFDINDIPFTTDANGDPTLNEQVIAIEDTGFYHVYQELSGVDCQRISLTYELQGLDFFNTNIDPFANATTQNDLLCPDTNVVEVTEILICGLTDTVTLGSTEYPSGTDVTWQRLDDGAGCTKSNDLCSYPDTSTGGASCFAPAFSTNHTETFGFNDEGVYKLTVTLNGGCPFEYYFNTISYGVTPSINTASGGECNSGDVVIELTGVAVDGAGNLDGYIVDFVTLDASNNIATTLANDSTTPSITIPSSTGNVRVQAIVRSDNAGVNSCSYLSNIENVTFFDLAVDTVNITREPSCFEDRTSTTTYDDSKGDVRIDLTGASAPFYYYYLRDTSDNSISQISGQQGTDYFEFEDVDPGNYEILAFSSSNTIATTDPIPNCTVVSSPFEIVEVPGYRAVVSTQQLSCNPAQITVTVEPLDPSNPINYNDIFVRFTDPNNTSNTSTFSYSPDGSIPVTFTVDDGSMFVTTVDPDSGDVVITTDSGADMFIDDLYTDESGSNSLDNNIQIDVFNSSCPLDIPNVVINPFDVLELTVTSPREPSCRNDNNGQVKVRADGSNTSDITGYEITAADDPAQVGRTTNIGGVFQDLTAGTYTFTAYQNIGGISCTAEVTYTLGEPDPITTPIIVIEQDYTCTTNEGHINLQTGFTVSGGSNPYTYRLLKYAESTLTTLEDTREVNNVNRLPLEGLTDGFYVLEIEDRYECTSELSNIIEFIELQEPELEYTATPVTCDTTNSTVQVSLVNALTNGDAIEGYSISNVTDPSNPTTPTIYTANTTGEFTLAPGDYEVTARTTRTQCISDVLVFTIDNVINIDAFNTSGGNDTLSCINANDGSVDYDLTGISAGGYSYTITRNTAAYTPITGNPQPSTNLTSTDFELTNLEQGAYEITFTDADTNCTDVVNFSISNPPAIVLSEAVAPQYSCSSTGLGTYTFQVAAVGGTGAISFSDGSATNTTGQFTVAAMVTAQTITITATDANSCPETINVTIPATEDLVITTPTAQCIDGGNNDEVTITFSGATGTIQYKEDGATTFTTATTTAMPDGTFIIDTNKTTGGTYTYLVIDDNNNESCARRVDITFNNDIDVENLTTTTVSCDAISGAQVTSGASVSFEVDGGTGSYTYTYETSTITTTTLIPDSGTTADNPTFSFDDSFDDQAITITINDASSCGTPFTLTYTPDYPEEPTIDNIDVPTFVCDGDTIDVTITPDFEAGEDLTSFTYIFDGVEQNSNVRQYTEDGTTSFTYAIKRRSTNCVSPTQNGTLNNVDPITVGTITTTPEQCIPSEKGTASIPIIGGTAPYTVTVVNLDDASLAPYVLNVTSNTANFNELVDDGLGNPPLEIGNHSVEIIDVNGCRLQNYTEFRIIPEPNVQFKNETIISNCIDKVIYFFEIEDGVGPFEIGLNLSTVIDPTIFGDDISKFGDTDFPLTTFNTEQTPAQIASYTDFNRVYAIIGLEFDQAYSVFVQDIATSCYSSADVDPQPSEDLIVSVTGTSDTSSCGLNSGAVEFSFDIIDPAQVGEDYIAEIVFIDGTIDTSVTPLLIQNVVATGNTGVLTGISGGSHILRIRPDSTTNECSGTANFTIDSADPLGTLEIAFSRGTSCIDPAQLELRVAGGGGVPPYEYLLQPSGDPAPISGDSTIFPETAVIASTTIQSFTDSSDNLIADAYIRDASGCVVGPLAINISALVEPELTLGISPEECNAAGAYTTTYTIGNYDATYNYTFQVNGDVPSNAQVTISAPDGSGQGTVSAQNRDAYVIEVTASNNPDCPASATFNLAEDVINIQATLGDVNDCNGNLEDITIEVVDGGFVGVATRQLVYEIYEGATVSGGILRGTLTPSPLETSVVFNAGTDYGSGTLILSADTDYSVRVTDYYDQTNFPTRFCSDIQEGLSRPDIVLPTLTVSPEDVSCSTTEDGQITLISSNTSGVTYALYEFSDATTAQTAIDNNLVETNGITVTSNPAFTQGNIFSNLKGASSAAYVGVVYATSLSCPVYSVVTSLSEPTNTPDTSFVIDGVDGNCDSTDLVTDALPRVTIQIVGTTPSALADYEITITPTVGGVANPFTFADLTLVSGTTDTYYIEGNSVPSQTYTVSISDTNTTCPPLSYTQTVNCETELNELGVTIPNYTIDCFDPSATINAAFEVVAANGNPLLFDYQIYPQGDSSNILASGNDITTSPITPLANLTEGTYILFVKDENEARIPPVTREFTVTMPDDLPNFTLTQARTGCDAVQITATPTNGTGTPNTGSPAYTFEISDAGGTSMTSQANGSAIYTVTAPASGTDTYTVTITDANSCTNTIDIDILPQEQLTATMVADEVCLNDGDANAVITINTGRPPFSFERTNTSNGNVTNGTITQTSVPFSVDNTITESGSYDYIIRDSFGCEVTVTGIVINNPLTLTIALNPASTACDASNNPETSSYDLTVSGGDSSYTYEVAIGETAINTNNFTTYTGPNYTVNASQEGERFAFRVSDGLNCAVVVEPALITFPTFPEVTFSNLQAIECPGENGSAVLTVDPTRGRAPYQIFVTETGSAFPATALSGDPIAGITFATNTVGIYDYKVIDANGCESAVGNFVINNSVIETLDFDIQDITCTAAAVVTNSGSIFLEVTNAEHPITFQLFEEGNSTVIATQVENVGGDYEHTFPGLAAGNYTIEVTDANNCQPFEFDATIDNNSPIVISNFQDVDTDCTSGGTGITMIFSVDGVGPFTIEHPNGGGLVDPLVTSDLVFKKDDLTDTFPGQGTVVASDNDKYYAFTGLAAGTEYTVLAQDAAGCQQRQTFRTPDSDAIDNISTIVTPETICNAVENTDGTIAVNFELGTSVAALFDVYLYNENETALAAPTQTGVAINPIADEALFTGLDGSETYVIRITENGSSPQCSNPIEVDVEKATELELNVPTAQSPVNCNGYVININASAQFGVPPYEFQVVPTGTAVSYTGTSNLTIDTNLGSDLVWDVYVRDSSLTACPKMQTITIINEPSPTFVIDPEFSVDQCETAVATYTVTGEITNFDIARAPYTFTLNGSAYSNVIAASGSLNFEVPSRGDYTIRVIDKNGCFAEDTITIYDELQITANLGNVDCDANVSEVTITVTGGFIEDNRTLTYEIFEVGGSGTAIETFTQPIATTTASYGHIFTGLNSLAADTDYIVTVTDAYSTANSCNSNSQVLRYDAIDKSTIRTIPTNITCNGLTDGTILIEDITVGDTPVVYELYSYTTNTNANNAVNANAPLSGTLAGTVNVSNEKLYEGLAEGWYVAFVTNGNSPACYTASQAIQILEPVLFTGNGLDAQPIQASCTPATDPSIEITITGVLDGEAPYYYKVDGLVNTFTEITDTTVGSSFIVPGVINPNTNYTVEFTDASGINCVPASTINVTINAFTANPFLELLNQDQAYSCSMDEIITIGVTNRLGTETYTINNISAIDFNNTPITPVLENSISDTDAQFTIVTPGRYVFEATSSLGCVSNELEYIVREAEQLLVEARGSIVACFGNSSSIEFEVFNYTGDYTYTYSYLDATNTTVTSPPVIENTTTTPTVTINGLNINTYTINVIAGTSGNTSCTNTALAQITGPNGDISFVGTDELDLAPTPAFTCSSGTATIITPEITGGTLPYTYTLIAADGSTASIPANQTGVFDITVNATNYTVDITDANNCSILTSAVKTVDPLVDPVITAIPQQDIPCFGDSLTFTVDVANASDPAFIAQGGVLTYALFYGNGIGGKGDQITPANTINQFTVNYYEFGYIVEVSDGVACPVTTEVIVTQPEQLNLSVDPTTPMSCSSPTEAQYTVVATRGATTIVPADNYTFEVVEATDLRGNQLSRPAPNNTGEFLLRENSINRISVTDANGCDPVTTTITVGDGIKEIDFDIEYTTTPLCNGDTNAFVQITDNLVSGGEGNYTYTILDDLGGTVYSSTTDDYFGNLGAGVYQYYVTSNSGVVGAESICSQFITFRIVELPAISLDVNEVSSVSCRFENDGEIRLKVQNNLFNAFPSITSFTYEISSSDDLFTVRETIDNDNDEAVFSDLPPDTYTYRVSINGSSACFIEGIHIVEDKDELFVSEMNSIPADCKGDEDGEKVYAIIGGGNSGSPSDYYYVLQEDNDTEPDGTTIVGNPTYLLDPAANGILQLTNLKADVVYSLFIYNSGNGQTGANLKVCSPWLETFSFPTEDLDIFVAEAATNCNNLNYTISVNNGNAELDETNLRISVYDRNTGVLVANGNTGLEPVDVAPGTYDVSINSITTGCESTTRYTGLDELETFSKVEFVEMDENGDPLYPFAATNEINVYQLQVTGGVEPNAIDAYTYTGIVTKTNGEVLTIQIDDEGKFEVKESGQYMFTVFDNYGDFEGNLSDLLVTCKDITSTIAITHIDIDIPNVFNPSSGDSTTNTWYPDNLTSSFNGITPVILDDDDEDVPRLPGVTSNTGGTVVGGTTTGGTTTNGVTIGGNVTDGTGSTVISGTTIGSTTTTTVTTGATTENGMTMGGTTITTTVTNGVTSVTVTIGGTISGGTVSNGVLIGGQVSGGTSQTLTGVSSGSDTVYNITTLGTTTGGSTNGGSTTGGTTSNGVTTGGTTTGATTIDGNTTGGTTVTITENGTGTIVTLTNNTTVVGGRTTNGVTTGGITTGGTLVGGTEELNSIEFLDYANMEVLIFDRYGRKLADFIGIEQKGVGDDKGWDGTYQGKEMPTGDYWYVIKLNDKQGREFTGHFTLYRR